MVLASHHLPPLNDRAAYPYRRVFPAFAQAQRQVLLPRGLVPFPIERSRQTVRRAHAPLRAVRLVRLLNGLIWQVDGLTEWRGVALAQRMNAALYVPARAQDYAGRKAIDR